MPPKVAIWRSLAIALMRWTSASGEYFYRCAHTNENYSKSQFQRLIESDWPFVVRSCG